MESSPLVTRTPSGPCAMLETGALRTTRSPIASAIRSESCCAPPSKRSSGPVSLVAKNGVSGSPQRIQKSAASNDVGVLLRENTPSIALANARLAGTDPTCAANHACSVVRSHSAASGAAQGSSGVSVSAIPTSAAALSRTARAASPSSGKNSAFVTVRAPSRQCTVAPSDQLGNKRTPSSSARPTMQCCPGLTHWPPSSTKVPSLK
jgi:hypothetical protein